LFSFQDARERERRWGLLEHSSVLVMQKGATEDLGLWLMEVPSGLEGGINYNADLFDSHTASLFRDRFVSLLKRVAGNPSQTVAELIEQPGDDVQAFRTWIAAHASQESGKSAASRTGSSGPRSGTPLSASESGLAQVWAALLGVPLEQIGTQDNFFDLGGNSLLAMQAVEEAERKLGLKVEPRRYLNEPLAAIAMPAGPYVELARIWADLLGIDASDVQPGDNFFDLGGNSLLVMRAAAETERLLGIKVDPRRYVNQTLQQLVSGDAAAAPVTGSTVPEKTARSGLVSRVLGRFGRGP
jgi:acyl carrier protein